MKHSFLSMLEEHPIIASVKDDSMLDDAINSPSQIIFLLGGNLTNLQHVVNTVQQANKLIFLHFDLINGLARDTTALNYIAQQVKPDGIITTRQNIIAEAKKLNLYAIQRVFLLDSLAYENSMTTIRSSKPNAIEVIPGMMPKVIQRLNQSSKIPLIAGGLILDKEDVLQALNAGARGISSSNPAIWEM